MDQPSTSATVSIPNTSVTSRCCAATLSRTAIWGNRARSHGGGVFDGEELRPLPSMFGTMMNQRFGFSALSSPMSHSLSQCRPEYQVG